MKLKKYRKAFFEDWLNMAMKLWKDESKKALTKELLEVAQSKKDQVFFAVDKEKVVAFVQVSIRKEHVQGATSFPVGYIEGLYVKPTFRKQGIARQLVKKGEAWASKKGCQQMGSDTWEWNKSSIAFHQKVGYQVENTLVHFLKKIKH